MSELTAASALDLATRIRTRAVSVGEVVETHLARLQRLDGELHAVVRFADSARAEAQRADRQLAAGAAVGPLHGVPFTVKDWLETNGLICDGGFPARRHHVPAADATAVMRLRRAGAILLAKTRAGSDPALHPRAANPFDRTRTPGSSSGGEAAVIAAGGSPLGLGSDSGGSLRWPAHCCGVAALKPSAGLVPVTGHYPPIVTLSDPRTVVGPLARRVADLGAALTLMAGPDGRDPSAVPVPVDGLDGAADSPGLRVAWFDRFGDLRPAPAVSAAVRAAVAALAPLTVACREAPPPRIDEAMDITRCYWARPESMALQQWQPWGPSRLAADEVERSLFLWDRLRRAFLDFMSEVDLLVCPVAAEPAPARQEPLAEDYAFTVPFSLSGNPVVVVRAGTSDEGLPLGVQLVAAPFADRLALRAGAAVEAALGPFAGPA